MGVGRKSGGVEAKDVLTAIVLADSFTQRFRPVTVERPKVLLPLANIPLLDAVLDWLARSGVEEVLVFCCAHAEAVVEHVERGRWKSGRGLRRVQTVVGANCLSLGDALRAVDQRGGMPSDFVLVAGDSVCNADLRAAVAAHRARRAQDRLAVATLLLKGGVTRAEADRLGVDTLQAAIDPKDGRLLKLEKTRKPTATLSLAPPEAPESAQGTEAQGTAGSDQGGPGAQADRAWGSTVGGTAGGMAGGMAGALARPGPGAGSGPGAHAASAAQSPPPFASARWVPCSTTVSAPRAATFDASQLLSRAALELRADLMDVGVAVLAPEALMLFTDNFDYQDVCGDFVSGVLSEEELGNKIHVHVLERDCYAARIDTFRTYAAVTADVLARRLYPFTPDVAKAPGGALEGPAAAAAAAAAGAAAGAGAGGPAGQAGASLALGQALAPAVSSGINVSFTVSHGLPSGIGGGGGGVGAPGQAPGALRAGGLAGALGAAVAGGPGLGLGGGGGGAAAALSSAAAIAAAAEAAASPPSRPAYRPAAPTGDRVTYNRGDVYVDASARVARDARLGPGTLVGAGASVGPGAYVSGSVLGRGAFVGARARVLDSVLLDDARVHADAWVSHALLCDRAVAREGSRVGPDVILGFGAVVSDRFAAPPGARVSLARQRAPAFGDDSDDDVEAPGAFGIPNQNQSQSQGQSQGRRLARRAAAAAAALAASERGEGSSPSPRSPAPPGAALRSQGSGFGSSGFGPNASASSFGAAPSSFGAASLGGASFGAGSYDEDAAWSTAAPADRALAAAAALARGRAPPEGSPAFDVAVVGPGGAGYAWIPPGDYDALRHGLRDLGPKAERIRRRAAAAAAAAQALGAGSAVLHSRSSSLGAQAAQQPLGASPTPPPSRLGGRGAGAVPSASAAASAATASSGSRARLPSPSFAWLLAEDAADADDDAYFGDAAARAAAFGAPLHAAAHRGSGSGSGSGSGPSAGFSSNGVSSALAALAAAPGAALPPHLLNRSHPRPFGLAGRPLPTGASGVAGTLAAAVGRHGLGTGSPATPGALASEGSLAGSAAPSPASRWGALGAAAAGGALGAGPSSGAGMATATDAAFKREVAETLLRSIAERIASENVVIELNGLKIAEDRTFADCARFMITTLLGLQLAPPPGTAREYRPLYPARTPDASTRAGLSVVVAGAIKSLTAWKGLLARFAGPEDDQVELLLTLEEYCGNEGDFRGEGGDAYAPAFARLLQALYEQDVISEAAFLQWADEKKNADAEDRVFLDRAKPFLEWLAQAEEDDSDDEDDDDDDEDEDEDDSDEEEEDDESDEE